MTAIGLRAHWRRMERRSFKHQFGAVVMHVKGSPEGPVVFTMAHKSKHHLVDRHFPVACYSDRDAKEHIKTGVEILAAELIYLEADFIAALAATGTVRGAMRTERTVSPETRNANDTQLCGSDETRIVSWLCNPWRAGPDPVESTCGETYGELLYKTLLRRRSCA